MTVGGHQAQAVLKAVQRDPVSSEVTHMDLLRISATREIQINVPLHFMHEEICLGVKAGGIITHLVLEVEVRCLPRDLPEYIEVDLGPLEIGETVHLSELKLPEGVELNALRGRVARRRHGSLLRPGSGKNGARGSRRRRTGQSTPNTPTRQCLRR